MANDHRQLAGPGEIYLDHVAWMVPDMAAAETAFARLGFALTPLSIHMHRDPATGTIERVGSANRLAMLRRGYLEIMTPVDGIDTPVVRHMREAMARHVGVHLVAFGVADAESEARRLARQGFRIMPTVHLRRTVEGPSGVPGEVAFTVVRPELGSIPEGRMQVLTHHTVDLMWQDRYIARDNAIDALIGVVLAVESPKDSAERLSQFTGRAAVPIDAGYRITLDRGSVDIITADACRALLGETPPALPSVAALRLSSRDLAAARVHLARAKIAVNIDEAGGLIVPSAAALGVCLLIAQMS